MNYKSLITLEQERTEFLKKYELDEKSINDYKLKINKVSEEEATNLGKELYELISKKGYNDNIDEIVDLINKGADIDYKDEKKGNFALLICARKNYLKTFILLIKAGANINQVNNYLTTATMNSARHGNKEILEILILMGADINARCLDGDNAIMSAKMHNEAECFNMLISYSAYLNNRNILNKTLADLESSIPFDLSQISSYISTLSNNETFFESSQKLLDEATNKLEIILKK